MPKSFPSPAGRKAELQKIRLEKLARSSHSFVRGNATRFYAGLKSPIRSEMPHGPPIWICGDAHVGNFGPMANAKGGVDIQIRDFDQTVIGNPAYDLIRLGLSLASAARGSDLPGLVTVRMIENVAAVYQEALGNTKEFLKAKWPQSVRKAYRAAEAGTWKTLAKANTENPKPNIPLGSRFWPLSKEEKKAITELFKEERVRRLVTSLQQRDDDISITVLDSAFWAKGCSSLGRIRYAVLLALGK